MTNERTTLALAGNTERKRSPRITYNSYNALLMWHIVEMPAIFVFLEIPFIHLEKEKTNATCTSQ